jgi:hypothetical protein
MENECNFDDDSSSQGCLNENYADIRSLFKN